MRGKGRDQHEDLIRYAYVVTQFPSPCGEKVGINAEKVKELLARLDQFPSPCGEKVGINPTWLPHLDGVVMVVFPSPCGEKVGINAFSSLLTSRQTSVSVPLRGKGRDQRVYYGKIHQRTNLFPSPCGEKVGINTIRTRSRKSAHLVSVPLRGKGRDQRPQVDLQSLRNDVGFRPLAGKR